MVELMRWADRRFEFSLPVGAFPCVLARLRGAPARIEDPVRGPPRDLLTKRTQDAWSIQEHIGHLLHLEELGERRIADFLARAPVLTAADMSNRKTHEAHHNARDTSQLLAQFRTERGALVAR